MGYAPIYAREKSRFESFSLHARLITSVAGVFPHLRRTLVSPLSYYRSEMMTGIQKVFATALLERFKVRGTTCRAVERGTTVFSDPCWSPVVGPQGILAVYGRV